jgi:hypothetical protein
MELFLVLVSVELLLFVMVTRRLNEIRRLRDELRKCHADLYQALASIDEGDLLQARARTSRWAPRQPRLPPPNIRIQ